MIQNELTSWLFLFGLWTIVWRRSPRAEWRTSKAVIDVRASGGSEDEGGGWGVVLSLLRLSLSLSLLPFALQNVLDRFTLSISGRGQGSELKHRYGRHDFER